MATTNSNPMEPKAPPHSEPIHASTTTPSEPQPTDSATPDNHNQNQNPDADSDSDLDLDLSDTDSPALAALQSSRLAELQSAAARASAAAAANPSSSPYSSLTTYKSEKAVMHAIAAAPLAILLFTHPSFPLCSVMGAHLTRIAALRAGAAAGGNAELDNVVWLSIEAERAPFLADRLRVRVLPCVVGYAKGEECGRLVGFEGLGKRAEKEAGWARVARVLRTWGILGKEKLDGEEDEDGEDESGSESEDGVGADGVSGRDGGRQGGWIGAGRSNRRAGVRAAANGARGEDDDEDDDWD